MYRKRPKYALLKAGRWFRSSEAALLLLSLVIGVLAGLTTTLQSTIAHDLQRLFYGIDINRLSALASIRHPLKLFALPLGGLLVGLVAKFAWPRQLPVDVVEANALHGGRIPMRDNFRVAAQTILSNGFGASVGLEATYAQAGGGLASTIGQWLRIRRADLRTLVGAGAGAAIGAAFGAPLTGAFYAFEVVIGAYAPAALAPVAVAALAAVLVTRGLGVEPYLLVVAPPEQVTTADYLLYAVFGVICALIGVAIMRAQTEIERLVSRVRIPPLWRPVIGGFILMPIAWTTPQALSAGHGALHLELALQPAITFLALVFVLKALASIVSLSFGFRGGLFFASLFLGSLLGPIYADIMGMIYPAHPLGSIDAALVGMAALCVTIVGAPMTLAMLALETTHDFALTGVVITATLCANAFTRSQFGYSFSTWRLHLRGSAIKSARDIGWSRALTGANLMRRDPAMFDAALTVGEFRSAVSLGSTSRVLLANSDGEYEGLVTTASAYDPALDPDTPIAELAQLQAETVSPQSGIDDILDRFESLGVEDLAVVDAEGTILGVLSEKYVARRYAEESEKALSELFRE